MLVSLSKKCVNPIKNVFIELILILQGRIAVLRIDIGGLIVREDSIRCASSHPISLPPISIEPVVMLLAGHAIMNPVEGPCLSLRRAGIAPLVI